MSMKTVECKLKSLKDQSLWTGVERLELSAGEVFVGLFIKEANVDGLVNLGVIERVDESVSPYKCIPIIPLNEEMPTALQNEQGEMLPLSDGLEGLVDG